MTTQTSTLKSQIIDRGRGPEIAGTRITVYDVLDYYKHGWHRDRIAALFRLSSEDIQAAIDYINQHKQEITDEYRRILHRHQSYQHPPDVQARVDQSRRAAKTRLEEIRRKRSSTESHAEVDG